MDEDKPKPGILNRLSQPFSALGRIMGRSGDGGADGRGDSPASGRPDSDDIVDDAFSMALDDLLNEEEERFQTKLQVISLVEFHEAVGTKWLRLKDKVMLIAEGVINQHIGQGNVFGRRGDDFFVLLFRTVSQAEGRRRSVIIAQELGTRLVGAQFIGGDRPLALAAELDLEDALNPGGGLRLDAIANAVGEVRAILPPTEEPGYSPHLGGALEEEQGRIHRAAALPNDDGPRELRAHMRPGAPVPAKDDLPLRRSMLPTAITSGGESDTPRQVSAPSWTAIPITNAKGGSSDDPGLGAAPLLPADAALTVSWRPVWVAETESIAAYKARIQRVDQSGQTPWEGTRAYPAGDEDSIIALDKVVVAAVSRELRTPEGARSAAMVVMPLHWASVASAHRLSILSPLGNLSEETRSARLVFDLFGIPGDLNADTMASALQSLMPLCRKVCLRSPLSRPQAQWAARAGAWALGVDLAELGPSERTDDSHLLAALSAVHDQAAAHGLRAYAWGIRRRAVVAGAVGNGFSMICGPGLMKDLPRLAKVLPAPRSRLIG